MHTWSRMGEISALFSGRSVSYVFSTSSVSASRSLDVLSREAVIMWVISALQRRSLICFSWIWSSKICFPVSVLYLRMTPSSPVAMMTSLQGPHTQRVKRWPGKPGIVSSGVAVWSAGLSAISYTYKLELDPMKGSVPTTAILAPCEKATARAGSLYLKVNSISPVWRSHSLALWSPDPVISRVLSNEMSQQKTAPLCPAYVPIRSPVSESQRHGSWSLPQLISRSPSRLYFRWVIGRE
mmetsp:Transcript_15820/g.28082  ORF Transcript_15820/g.28082 Transcript_15820/m.28082 type:complete len:239 (+) Transcript_15820:432-1148(+)